MGIAGLVLPFVNVALGKIGKINDANESTLPNKYVW